MLAVSLIGALLLMGGVVYMGWAAVNRGRMSDPEANPTDTSALTLEPRHRGLGFLGWRANWPGLLMVVVGGLLLLLPVL
jgi:uncharacterized membrane protein HdeD (DUF308 family)